ncbi:MAG: macro domain-containing protein [Clostridia bacterium]|nr:macro domain-containing protein [Clostridia bacterium]
MITQIIEILKGDITQLEVDVIVNAANEHLIPGGGVDGAIHRAGGSSIREEAKVYIQAHKLLNPGEVMSTTAGLLRAKRVIHTVGPRYKIGEDRSDQLRNCYKNSMVLAEEEGMSSVAFPCISAGVFGYPIREAAEIAFSTVVEVLAHQSTVKRVYFVCFDEVNFSIYNQLYQELTTG